MTDPNDSKKKKGRDSGKGKGRAVDDGSSSTKGSGVLDQAELVNMLREMQTGGQVSGPIFSACLSHLLRSRKRSWISTSSSFGKLSRFKISVHEHQTSVVFYLLRQMRVRRQYQWRRKDQSRKWLLTKSKDHLRNFQQDMNGLLLI
jgi:hypothetical protein